MILDLCHQAALTPLPVTLQPVPPWRCLTVHQQYIIRATRTKDTHTVFVTHILCIFSHRESLSEACPPHSHTNRRECFVLSLTDWAATEERERGWWEEVDGDSKRQKDYKEKQTQTDRDEEIQLVKGAEETHPPYSNWWEERESRAGKGIQK